MMSVLRIEKRKGRVTDLYKQRIPSSARPKPDVAYLAHYPFVHRNICQTNPWYSLDASDHLYLMLPES